MKQTDTQRPIFNQMVCGPLSANLAEILYPDRRLQDTIISNYAYKVKEPPHGMEKKDIEHDVILLMFRYGIKGKKGKLEEGIIEKDVISIEIKTTASDVKKSSVEKYLGATRMFFVAAPVSLLPVIINKYYVLSRKNSHIIGLIDSDTGQVVVRPQFQIRNMVRQDHLLAHCYTSVHRIPMNSDTRLFSPHQVSCLPEKTVTWIDIDGLKVNWDYKDLF